MIEGESRPRKRWIHGQPAPRRRGTVAARSSLSRTIEVGAGSGKRREGSSSDRRATESKPMPRPPGPPALRLGTPAHARKIAACSARGRARTRAQGLRQSTSRGHLKQPAVPGSSPREESLPARADGAAPRTPPTSGLDDRPAGRAGGPTRLPPSPPGDRPRASREAAGLWLRRNGR